MANKFEKCFRWSEGIFQPTIYIFLIVFIDPITIRKIRNDFVFNRTIIYSKLYYRRNSKNNYRSNRVYHFIYCAGLFSSSIHLRYSTTNFDKPLFLRQSKNELVSHKEEDLETYWHLLTSWSHNIPHRIFSDVYSHDYLRILIFYNG